MSDEEIIKKFVERAEEARRKSGARKGWVPWIFPTSLFIRDYLLEKGEAYPFEIYRALKKVREGLGLHVGSPVNFYKYIYALEKLGLIERTGRIEPAFRSWRGATKSRLPREKWRTYYRIAKGKENAEEWLNPQRALYEKMVREGRWRARGRREG
jgi:hypothetical protein